jgi:hypothetical protein
MKNGFFSKKMRVICPEEERTDVRPTCSLQRMRKEEDKF